MAPKGDALGNVGNEILSPDKEGIILSEGRTGNSLRALEAVCSFDTFLGGSFLTDYKVGCYQLKDGDSSEFMRLQSYLYQMYDALMRIHGGIEALRRSLTSFSELAGEFPVCVATDAQECICNLIQLLEIMEHSRLEIGSYLSVTVRERLDGGFAQFAHISREIIARLTQIGEQPLSPDAISKGPTSDFLHKDSLT